MNDDSPRPTTITKLAYGVFESFALLAAMKLGLFTKLSPDGCTASALATALETDEDRLRPLVDLLVSTGLVTRAGERLINAPEAEAFLVEGRPDYRGGLAGFYERLWRAALQTADSVRAGAPCAKLDFSEGDPDALLAFFRRQYPSSLMAGQELCQYLDFSRHRTLADLGGGTGGTSIALCSAVATLRSTVYELPSVVPITARFIAEAGLGDRVAVRTLDASQHGREGDGEHDLALLRSVLQVLDERTAQAVLHSAFKLLRPGGELLIVGSVLRDTRDGPAPALARGLVFLNVYDSGQSYTEGQHRRWLSDAGFIDVRVDYSCMRDGTSTLRARRPGA